MFDLCSKVSIEEIIEFANVEGPTGLFGGIRVNDKNKRTILIQTIHSNVDSNPYPDRWDDDIPGMVHYCATRKGVPSSVTSVNLNSKLNMFVNLGIYPIFLFVRFPDKTYKYMGEFIRLSKYDEDYVLNGYQVYVFALISKNINAIQDTVSDIKLMLGQ